MKQGKQKRPAEEAEKKRSSKTKRTASTEPKPERSTESSGKRRGTAEPSETPARKTKKQKQTSTQTTAPKQHRKDPAVVAEPVTARVKRPSRGRRVAEIVTALVLVAGLGSTVGYLLVRDAVSIDSMTQQDPIGTVQVTDENGVVQTQPPTQEVTEALFDTVACEHTDIYKGPLMLVNQDYAFNDTDAEIVTLYEYKTESYSVSGMSIRMQKEAVSHLNDMLDAFCAETGHTDILIVDGYRTQEEQQQLYDQDLELNDATESTLVALPGHSEHETGYALDFSLYFEDGSSGEYDGTGDYAWMDENCAKYGYILRYPEHKTPLTGIQYESWHYRYVGVPHAFYIMQNGLCLEEYMDLLHQHTWENPLELVNADGEAYATYFVAADPDEALSTFVPVPQGASYTISGNNIDGFIVTVDLKEKRDIPEPVTEAAPEETVPEDELAEPAPDAAVPDEAEDSTAATEEIVAVG